MSALRLFIAVPCRPSRGLATVLARLDAHRPALKPVAADQLHVTLRFLDDQPEARVAALAEAVQQAVADAGVTAASLPLGELTVLPPGKRRPPRTVCVDIAEAGPLHALSGALDRRLTELDPPMPPRDRPFRAHLTLARVKAPPRHRRAATSFVDDLLAEHAQAELGHMTVDAVHLVASKLTPRGPVHRCLHATPLPTSGDAAP